ncbi:hypothetical protein [Parapedobacter indicus]|uniref:Uncharacterized protein n=1 Tax=Parapedobacter indicus TaxID=1477437 RepID=A0A1I3NJX3_9SPHI|nr:hypothetical protein [Parapedobacter indicus]PPL01011.1 hypothetical protein CLV26_107232 [Parapedobacter indicus]SFJ09634.1 hypothetical protein SAMN05444682_107232 [Parapedobacter indicus]
MKKTIKPIVWYSMTFLATVFCACKKSSVDDDPVIMYLRIVNDTDSSIPNNMLTGPITVKALPNKASTNFDGEERVADFGTIAVGETTAYKAVSNMFLLEVNGAPFGEDGFGVSSPPSTQWTLKIQGVQEWEGEDYVYAWDLAADF